MEKKQYASPCCDLVRVCRDAFMEGGLIVSKEKDPWQAEGKQQTLFWDEEEEVGSEESSSYWHVNVWDD